MLGSGISSIWRWGSGVIQGHRRGHVSSLASSCCRELHLLTAGCVLSGMAPTRLSACDMGTSSSPKVVDSVCLVSAFLHRSCVCSHGCLILSGSMPRARENATAAVDQRGEQDLQPVQGWGKLSGPTQGEGQPTTCFNRSTWCVVTARAVPTQSSWPGCPCRCPLMPHAGLGQVLGAHEYPIHLWPPHVRSGEYGFIRNSL